VDKVKFEILEDGTIKSTTDPISPEEHQSAEAFFKYLASLTGGTETRVARGDAGVAHHHHHGGHEHTHGGGAPHSH